MIYVIGISGKAGGGKDTLAEHMTLKLRGADIGAETMHFAKALKDYGRTYFGEICDPVVKDPVSRAVLQGIGQMFREVVSQDYWVERVVDKIKNEADTYTTRFSDYFILIPDVRHPNEADFVKHALNKDSIGGYDITTAVVRINGRTSLKGEAAEHISETALDNYEDFDFVYENTGTLEGLFEFGSQVLVGVMKEKNVGSN